MGQPLFKQLRLKGTSQITQKNKYTTPSTDAKNDKKKLKKRRPNIKENTSDLSTKI